MLQIVLTAAVSECMYLYTSLKSTSFSSLSFYHWGWMQMGRAGWEPALEGGQFSPLSVIVLPHGTGTVGSTDRASAWQRSLQFWSRDLGIPNALWTLCSSLDTSTGGGYQAFQFADGETQTTCPVSEGPRDSQHCVEQKPVPQSMSNTGHWFLLKPGFGEWAVIFQVFFVCPHP